MARVLLRSVWKRYGARGDVVAVRDLNLECKNGEFLCILGPSGCGKSSTMRMIAGLEAISQGEIIIGETVVNNVPPKNRDVAMVFENYALYPHLNVFENIGLCLEARHVAPTEIDRKVRWVANMLDVTDLLRSYPSQLGGGQKQRVAIARALVREPTVLIMDEPISHIDSRLRSHVRGQLKKMHQDLQTTTVYVTHNQLEALSLGDRVAVMKDGELQQVGPPQSLFDNPANLFVADFVGEPPINLFDCDLIQDGGKRSLRGDGFQLDAPAFLQNGPVNQDISPKLVGGVRPQDIEVVQGEAPGAEFTLGGKVSQLQSLGDQSIVAIDVGKQMFQALVSRTSVTSGDSVKLAFSAKALHLFDKKSGAAVRATK